MGFGERLQREREMRKITLDEIANATKIGTRSLRALEEEDFSKLPGGIFNKGFVRAYARYLGIDEEQAVADYIVATGEAEHHEAALDDERLKKLEANWKIQQNEKEGEGESSVRVPWGALAAILILVAVAGAGWHFRHKAGDYYQQLKARLHHQTEPVAVVPQNESSAPSSPAVPAVPASDGAATTQNPTPTAPATSTSGATSTPTGNTAGGTNVPAPSGTNAPTVSGTTAGSTSIPPSNAPVTKPTGNAQTSAIAPEAQEFVLLVRARQDSWVNIIADGKPVLKGMLKAAREESIRAHQKVTLTAGNAAGIEVSFNGKPQPSLGDSKQVRTVTFTPEGMQQ